MTENRYPIDESAMQEQADWMAGRGGSAVSRLGRLMSERTSRRSMLGMLGRWGMGAAGVAIIGSLPVTRAAIASDAPKEMIAGAGRTAAAAGDPSLFPAFDETGDSSTCEYWRWCNMDGTPSAVRRRRCHHLRPAASPSAEFWVGCCTNPDTGKTYLIAYYDCCGAPSCSNAFCGEPDMQAVMYDPVLQKLRPGNHLVCLRRVSACACTMAPIIGEDCQTRPAERPKVGAGS